MAEEKSFKYVICMCMHVCVCMCPFMLTVNACHDLQLSIELKINTICSTKSFTMFYKILYYVQTHSMTVQLVISYFIYFSNILCAVNLKVLGLLVYRLCLLPDTFNHIYVYCSPRQCLADMRSCTESRLLLSSHMIK